MVSGPFTLSPAALGLDPIRSLQQHITVTAHPKCWAMWHCGLVSLGAQSGPVPSLWGPTTCQLGPGSLLHSPLALIPGLEVRKEQPDRNVGDPDAGGWLCSWGGLGWGKGP